MNVDTFGHHIFKKKRVTNSLVPVQFLLKCTDNDNFSAQNKIIKHLKNPEDATDSASKEYVDRSISELLNIIKTKNKEIITEIENKLRNLETKINLKCFENEQKRHSKRNT